jgi:hypothetical protein
MEQKDFNTAMAVVTAVDKMCICGYHMVAESYLCYDIEVETKAKQCKH